MKLYRLFLTKDARTGVNYHQFISFSFGKRDSYVRKVKLGDVLARKYQYQTVLLKLTETTADFLEVEVSK